MLSDEVRRNIPDILLATMNILFTKHKVKNGILFSKLLWPTVRKIILVVEKNFWN